MNVLIAGCGYLGTAAGSLLAGRHAVYGLRRSAAGLEKAGILPIEADLTDPATLTQLPDCDAAVLAQARSRPDDDYGAVHLRGTLNLLQALTGRPRLVLVSSTRVYGTQDGSWVDEDTPPRPELHPDPATAEKAELLLEAESLVLKSRFPAMVLRLGGIYGPGRERSAGAPKAQNRVRVDRAAAAVALLLERGKPGEIYLGVEDHPGGEPAAGKRCSNRKLKALGWNP